MSEVDLSSSKETLDTHWQVVQKKTFTKWINMKLAAKGYPEISDVSAELSDGIVLIRLIEIIGDTNLGKYVISPKLRIQKVENVNKALRSIRENNVPLTNIGAEDIVDMNEKLILGMLWIIILRFTISEISEGELSAKEGLLLWCQKKTAGYRGVNIRDFSTSWQDGLAFSALIHRHRPDLINFNDLYKESRSHNLENAFEIARTSLSIPRLLDVEDLVSDIRPDERSVMTYVAQYFHAFNSATKLETAIRRIKKLAIAIDSVFEMRHSFEARVHNLQDDIASILDSWNVSVQNGSYSSAKQQLLELINFKNGKKRIMVSEKRDLDTLFGNIQTKLKTYHMKPYVPSEGLSLKDLEANWEALILNEGERKKALNNAIRAIKDDLRQKFATLANSFEEELNKISSHLSSLDGELEVQLKEVQSLTNRLGHLETRIPEIMEVDFQCQAAHIEENDYTIYNFDDLIYDSGLVRQSLQKKSAFIDNQIVMRKMDDVSPQQLNEFESTFHHFDRDQNNTLSKNEFKSGLAGLGIVFNDADFIHIFNSVSKGKPEVDFEQFISYMKSTTADTTSVSQMLDSFTILSNNKVTITREELLQDVKAEEVNFESLLKLIPCCPDDQNSLDFRLFFENHFVQTDDTAQY